MTDHAALINNLTHHARRAAQYAATWDINLYAAHIYPTHVEVAVHDEHHARILAAAFDLNVHRSYDHLHNRDGQVHHLWSSLESPLRVVCVTHEPARAQR